MDYSQMAHGGKNKCCCCWRIGYYDSCLACEIDSGGILTHHYLCEECFHVETVWTTYRPNDVEWKWKTREEGENWLRSQGGKEVEEWVPYNEICTNKVLNEDLNKLTLIRYTYDSGSEWITSEKMPGGKHIKFGRMYVHDRKK